MNNKVIWILFRKTFYIYILLCALVYISSLKVYRYTNHRLATAIVKSLENKIYFGNFAEVIANIHQFLNTEFDAVAINARNREIIALPNKIEFQKIETNMFTMQYQIPVEFSADNISIVFL